MVELESKTAFTDKTLDWDSRAAYVKSVAWFILTSETAASIAAFLNGQYTIEVFAGNGRMAHHMRQLMTCPKSRYRAYDNCSGHFTKPNGGTVVRKNAFMAPIKKADVIVMNWPPYATNHAYRIAAKMVPGQYLIYNGEGDGGCTGDDRFHDYLTEAFEPCYELSDKFNDGHVMFFGIHDQWHVYRKRSK